MGVAGIITALGFNEAAAIQLRMRPTAGRG